MAQRTWVREDEETAILETAQRLQEKRGDGRVEYPCADSQQPWHCWMRLERAVRLAKSQLATALPAARSRDLARAGDHDSALRLAQDLEPELTP